MSREKGSIFKKVFFYKKDPPIALWLRPQTVFILKPDRCAGGCRQESSLCVVLFSVFFLCGFRNVKTESRAFFFFVCFCVFVVMAAGFVFSVAVGRMNCACRDERWEGQEKVGTQETGKRKCRALRGRGQSRGSEDICCERAAGWTLRYVFFLLWSY